MSKVKASVSQEDICQRGYRVNLAINIANVSTVEFATLYQEVNKSSLYDWIKGKTCLTKRGAAKMTQAMHKHGYFCSEEWLLFGTGLSPTRLEDYRQGIHPYVKPSTIDPADQKKLILAELDFFKSLHANACSALIEDQAMLPLLNPGDYVAGLKVDVPFWHHYYDRPCLVYVKNLDPLVRCFNKNPETHRYHLYSLNQTAQGKFITLDDANIEGIAPIVWHRYNIASLKEVALAGGFLKTRKSN